MKYYEVSVVLNGKKRVLYQEADNKQGAVQNIQNTSGGTLLKIKEVPLPVGVRFGRFKESIIEKFGKRKVNIQEFSVFLRQLAVMTDAGISLRDALAEGINSTSDKQIKRIAVQAMEDIESGLSFTDSLQAYEHEVGSISLAVVRMGEMTGRLSESFEKLAMIQDSIKNNRDNIKKALRMPAISLTALAGAFVFLVMVVVPKFKGIFSKFGADLPLPTQLLLGIESALSNYGLYIAISLVGVFFLHRRMYADRESYRYRVDRLMLRIFLVGRVVRLSMLERFVMVMSELMKAGIPLTDALETSAYTVENRFLRDNLLGLSGAIQRGASLAEAMEDTGLFERMVIQMVKSGESSGQIDTMLGKIADYYGARFQNIIDNISTIIEPMLMIVVAAMVLLLALGIFLPMWDIASAAKG